MQPRGVEGMAACVMRRHATPHCKPLPATNPPFFASRFASKFTAGFQAYLSGDWPEAQRRLEECRTFRRNRCEGAPQLGA